MRRTRLKVAGWMGLLACFAIALLVQAPARAAAQDAEIEAVWRKQQITFVYNGYSTFYTCSGLRRKLHTILTKLGARDTLTLRGYACDEESGSVRFDIHMESPVSATPDNITALTTYTSEQRLVARVHGEQLPDAANIERFPATWEKISFAHYRSMNLEPGDCELVEQLMRSILPRMSVQIVSNNLRCSPFGNYRPPRLTVVALIAQQEPTSVVTNPAAP